MSPFGSQPAPGFSDNSAPLLMTASTGIILPGSSVECDSEALTVPFRKPAIIDEVRWSVRRSGGSNPNVYNPGGLVGCRLSLGGLDLTNKFVPLWLFGPVIQDPGLTERVSDTDFGAALVNFATFRWKMPVPLEVPSGLSLRAEISLAADNFGDTQVDIAYAGRYLGARDKIAKTLRVPYVSTFITKRGDTYAESGEKDLWNPFQVPLNVQRFVGRLEYRDSGRGFTVNEAVDPTTIHAVKVKMRDSVGDVITRGEPHFYSIFEGSRRAWTFGRQLHPKEQYYATVFGLENSLDAGVFTNAQVSLVGWREAEIHS